MTEKLEKQLLSHVEDIAADVACVAFWARLAILVLGILLGAGGVLAVFGFIVHLTR